MKKYFFLLLLALFFNSSFAQTLFRRGFIVVNSGDTLQCEIAADLIVELKDRVRVRQKGSTDIIVYTPDKLLAFYFDLNNVFVPVTIEGKSVFLRSVVAGYFSLYVFPETSNSFFYYLKNNDAKMIKLVNTITIVQVGERTYKKSAHEYIGALKVAMRDQPELSKRIDKARLDEHDLVDIVKRYNQAKDPKTDPVQFAKDAKPTLNFGPLVGYSKFIEPGTMGGVRGGVLASLHPTKFETRLRYNIGLFYNKAEYVSSEKGQYTLEMPVYVSFYPLKNKTKIAPYISVGLRPSYYSGYDSDVNSSEFFVPLFLGTGIDIKSKKRNYMKVDVSFARGFGSISLGYMF